MRKRINLTNEEWRKVNKFSQKLDEEIEKLDLIGKAYSMGGYRLLDIAETTSHSKLALAIEIAGYQVTNYSYVRAVIRYWKKHDLIRLLVQENIFLEETREYCMKYTDKRFEKAIKPIKERKKEIKNKLEILRKIEKEELEKLNVSSLPVEWDSVTHNEKYKRNRKRIEEERLKWKRTWKW